MSSPVSPQAQSQVNPRPLGPKPRLEAAHAQTPRPGGPAARVAASPALDRALLSRYCLACHNAKLKTAGLSLDGVDLTQPAAHAEVRSHPVRIAAAPEVGKSVSA